MTRAEKFRIAAEWLEAYEPAPSEDDRANAAAMQEVADFLRRQADHDDREALVRSLAKEAGRTIVEVRRAMRAGRDVA